MKKQYWLAACTIFCWGTLPAVTKRTLTSVSNMQVLFISAVIAAREDEPGKVVGDPALVCRCGDHFYKRQRPDDAEPPGSPALRCRCRVLRHIQCAEQKEGDGPAPLHSDLFFRNSRLLCTCLSGRRRDHAHVRCDLGRNALAGCFH